MPAFSSSQQRAIEALARDLEDVFGPRLQALVAYPGSHSDGSVHSCALVDGLAFRSGQVPAVHARWHQRRTAVPLMLSADELQRTLDVFPLEYATIAADHVVVRGVDPFAGLTVALDDLRRALEAQAKSHLIHLREAYLESHGEATRIANVIAGSAPPLRALLTSIARLPDGGAASPDLSDEALAKMAETRIGVQAAVVRDVLASSTGGQSTITDPTHLFSRYLDATQKIWEFVDAWSSR